MMMQETTPLLDRLAGEAHEEVADGYESYRDPPGPPASPAEIAQARARLAAAEAARTDAQAKLRDLVERQQRAIRNRYGEDVVRRLTEQVAAAERALVAADGRVRAARQAIEALLLRARR
jgi:pyruvate/2-oxoacid:ferredoxin oxidoreductase alpha subunit